MPDAFERLLQDDSLENIPDKPKVSIEGIRTRRTTLEKDLRACNEQVKEIRAWLEANRLLCPHPVTEVEYIRNPYETIRECRVCGHRW